MEPIAHFCMSHERNQAALEGAKAAFDFSLGLWGRRDEMSDAKGPQCALELAPGIGVVIAGAGSEKAQRVGVNGLGDAVCFKGISEVAEVVPSGVGGHETSGQIESGRVVN